MKTALVTGSSRGIGRAIADMLHDNGYTVVYSGTKPQRPDNLPPERDFFPCDIADAAQRQAAIAHVLDRYGRLDLLVNNAGVAPLVRRDLLEMDEESFDRVIGINLKGTLFMCQLAAKAMLAGKEQDLPDYHPRIVNTGSMSAYTSSTSRGEYCISKAGLGMVTKLFADRLAAEGIPVFEVRPGIIDTDMTKVVHEKYDRLIRDGLLPIPRFGKPEDVAKMVLACASGLLDYSAGQVLDADGGFALRRL
ncbi:MAG: 3-ketoacyl-ACP reductase [Eubacteriales bacterium]|nr:3-ketoacyl-ACP reductase [Eubacteriales bacterium]